MFNFQRLSFMRKQPYFEILCALYSPPSLFPLPAFPDRVQRRLAA